MGEGPAVDAESRGRFYFLLLPQFVVRAGEGVANSLGYLADGESVLEEDRVGLCYKRQTEETTTLSTTHDASDARKHQPQKSDSRGK